MWQFEVANASFRTTPSGASGPGPEVHCEAVKIVAVHAPLPPPPPRPPRSLCLRIPPCKSAAIPRTGSALRKLVTVNRTRVGRL